MIELDAVEIREPLVPVVRVPLHDPFLVLDPLLAAERAGAGIDLDLAQIVIVVLQRLLADDDIPAAGDRRHDEIDRPRLGQLELHGVFVGRGDFRHRLEQHAARDRDPLRRLGDAVEGGFHIFGGQLGAVMELHALTQMKRVGLAVLGDFPAMRQVGDDRLAAVARVAPDQIVEHAALRAEIVDRPGLVHVEMRRPHRDAVAKDAAPLWVRLGRGQLELRAIEFKRHIGGQPRSPAHRIGARGGCGAGLQEIAAVPAGTRNRPVSHRHPSPSHLFRADPNVL